LEVSGQLHAPAALPPGKNPLSLHIYLILGNITQWFKAANIETCLSEYSELVPFYSHICKSIHYNIVRKSFQLLVLAICTSCDPDF
jgi:hypothetical protein